VRDRLRRNKPNDHHGKRGGFTSTSATTDMRADDDYGVRTELLEVSMTSVAAPTQPREAGWKPVRHVGKVVRLVSG